MKNYCVILVSGLIFIALSGCVSTSTSDHSVLISPKDNVTINKKVLFDIQALRASQKTAVITHRFVYPMQQITLNQSDKSSILKLLLRKNKHILIKIGPAKANTLLQQLSLSIKRAEVLRRYILGDNNTVAILFSPKLSSDTVSIVVGA